MKVNEIFYSIQGEGYHTGTAAVFVRLSGCNLKCPFCDTNHQEGFEMTEEDIVSEVIKHPTSLVVITGGEPSLQLTDSLVDKLHSFMRFVAVETNGTRPLPENVDWITVSPKKSHVKGGDVVLKKADEIKLVATMDTDSTDLVCCTSATHLFIQPCDTGDDTENRRIIEHCIELVKRYPEWRLSLQTQKILNVR